MILTQEDLRCVGLWAADCAERVLPLFEARAPADTRPREAIEGIREFARGGKRTARLRSLAMAAHAAGWTRFITNSTQAFGVRTSNRSVRHRP